MTTMEQAAAIKVRVDMGPRTRLNWLDVLQRTGTVNVKDTPNVRSLLRACFGHNVKIAAYHDRTRGNRLNAYYFDEFADDTADELGDSERELVRKDALRWMRAA